MESPSGQFANETAVARTGVGPGRDSSPTEAEVATTWTTHITADWNINQNPNGGYAASSSLRAMVDLVPSHPDVLSVSTHYLRPCLPAADAEIRVEAVRRGRRTSNLRSTLIQDNKPRLITTASVSNFDLWQSPHRFTIEPGPLPPPERCIDRSQLGQGVDLPILSRLDVRLDPKVVDTGASERPYMAGWIRFADGTDPSVLSLPLFADAFPPSPMAVLGPVGWIPTVELTVHVRARPAPGWIQAQFRANDVSDGTLIEDGLLWDSEGTLIAQCRQIALLGQ